MSDSRDSLPLDHLPLDRLLKVNEVCNRLEAELRSGQSPSLEALLAEGPEGDRAGVRAELEALLADWQATRPPSVLGAYRLEGPLGQGGMGRVYRAIHTTMKRTVALKIVIGQDASL